MPIPRLSLPKSVWNKVLGKMGRPSPEGRNIARLLAETKKTFPPEGGAVLWAPSAELRKELADMLTREERFAKNVDSTFNLALIAAIKRLREYQDNTEGNGARG